VREKSISSFGRKVSKREHQKENLRRSSEILHRECKEHASELLRVQVSGGEAYHSKKLFGVVGQRCLVTQEYGKFGMLGTMG
jgi:hypothetical protein